ncbi:MAG: hypothetical protein Crog4KO_06760 [Crocinitomicaceae bacterium]
MSDQTSIAPKRPSSSKLLDDQMIDRDARVSEKKKNSWWSSLTPTQHSIITWTAITLGVSLVAAGGIYFASRFVRKKIAKTESSKSFGKDKHATWAKQIKNAFVNDYKPGTDEELLRRALREIPTKQDWEKVKKSYAKQNKGAVLTNDMNGELSATEFVEMLAILDSKPKNDKVKGIQLTVRHFKNWAKRLRAAISYQWMGAFWGTDEDAVKAVFQEIPSQKAYKITKYHYKKLYGTSMVADLRADMDDFADYYRIIKRKPYSIYDKG